MKKGEFELIGWIKGQFEVPEGILGIGDDCAVIPQRDGLETLVTTDMLVEGVHFLLEDIDPYSLGWKSAAVNLSDIAGMGGRPVGSFLSTALPKSIPDGFTEEFIRGYKDISDRFNCPLLGGDTTASKDRLCISVTVLGSCGSGQSLKRSGARPGDLVCVTGTLGDSAAGLRLILERSAGYRQKGLTLREMPAGYPENHPTLRENARRVSPETPDPAGILVERHYRPVPRIAEGLRLAATTGVGACMDISDGVGSDLRHILEASGVSARVDVRSLPLSAELRDLCARRGWEAAELALDGGEDYELLFTCRPGTPVSIPHSVIGEILAAPEGPESTGSVIIWEGADRDFTGFRHF